MRSQTALAALKAVGTIVSRETLAKLECLVHLIVDENTRQNLVSADTLGAIWHRHVADSAQLVPFAEDSPGPWLDLGSGAGFPGLVAGVIWRRPVILVESRTKRADFLRRAVETLGLPNVEVIKGRLEIIDGFKAPIISARAFAPLSRLLALAHRFSTTESQWLLPKGRSAIEELASVRATWHGDFRIEPSRTDPSCGIIVARNVRPKGKAR